MSALPNDLDKLLATIRAAVTPAPADAIDRELARTPRQTQVVSLLEDPAILRFRQELMDGHVRIDTVHQVLNLINQILPLLLTTGAAL